MGNSKEPIRLRKRKTKSGNTSLYLDIYLNRERSYEYLKLYLIPERNRADKEKNRETLQLAEAIKSKRVVELRNGEFGFKNGFATDTLFF
ncbi:Arm DNA-binding domain-containing protein [Bacteroides sp. AN502(2024)]|uniref:Arm DNA-binding domain-containing protein n=1 Tax=Bacteroides sp. AN502(2024) TaxID=3160599 RepID=UPI0035137A64